MIAPLLASLLLVVQNRPALDSATVTRVLNQLQASDSTVCALAGEALTNYGGFWGHRFADPGMPMPQPMPTPMPMPGGGPGEVHVDMHENTRDMDPAVLRAFRAVIRDDNRCVRNIAARVLGNHGGSEAYNLFIGMLKDARADFRETGALGLGERQDSRAITPLSDALGSDASPAVRMTAAWALGELEEKIAVAPLKPPPPANTDTFMTPSSRCVSRGYGHWARSKTRLRCRCSPQRPRTATRACGSKPRGRWARSKTRRESPRSKR